MLTITKDKIAIDDFSTIYDRLINSFKSIYGDDVNLDSDTPDGQLLALFAKELSYVHESCAFLIQMLDPYQATGQWLSQRAMYAGLKRIDTSYSYVNEVIILGGKNTLIPADTVFTDKNKNKWVALNAITLNNLGSGLLKLRSKELGNYKISKGDEFELSTIILGVTQIIASKDGEAGTNEESDFDFLKRFMMSHSINNYDERTGIKAALLNIVGVEKCEVYENYTSQTDEKGIPAHSINAVILGGDEESIAKVIAMKKIGGCGLYGKHKANYYYNDYDRSIYFDRPELVDISVSLTVKRYKNYTDINVNQIEDDLKSIDFDISEKVYASRIISQINQTNGFYITSLTVNKEQVVDIDHREYAKITSVEVIVDE